MSERPFDLVVLGATGVTGAQAVKYLAERIGALDIRWAIAGRNQQRLAEIAAQHAPQIECLHADIGEPDSLDAMAASTAVIANLAGPYARLGTPVYEACIRNSTHQVDACGEMDWLRDQIIRFDAAARASDVTIVHTAGFEALPFDLGARMLAEHYGARDDTLTDVDVAINVHRDPPILSPVDLLSGGTLASGADAMRRGVVDALEDARYLDVEPHEALAFDTSVRRHEGTGTWLAPMVPSPHINPAIAHRSHLLLRDDGHFAENYRFREGLVSDNLLPGMTGSLAATVMASAQVWTTAMASAPPLMRTWAADMAEAFGPKPGSGPDRAHLDGWTWQLHFRGTGSSGRRTDMVAQGSGHPGYRSSANFVAETALALATDPTLQGAHGFRTPATALGADPSRFAAAGLIFGAITTPQ